VHTGGGAFDDLEHLKPGAVVRVATDHGALAYAVTQATVYPKRTLASDAARIFSQSVPGRLVLVTCEDWNGHGYESNVVVVAEPRG
jgi:sortase (surface protein transpeptidase)